MLSSTSQPNCAASTLAYKGYDHYIGDPTFASASQAASYQYSGSDIRFCWAFYTCSTASTLNYMCKINKAVMPCYPPPAPPPPPPSPPSPPWPPSPVTCKLLRALQLL